MVNVFRFSGEVLPATYVISVSKPGYQTNQLRVPITKAGVFYAAEDYHQDFYKKSALRYGYSRAGCGRDARLEQLWGKAAVKK